MSSTMVENDRRFSNKDKKFLASTTFPPNFSQKVDLKKVNTGVFRPWVVKETERLLGFEDEVVVEFVMGMLEDSTERSPDPRKMQALLLGFLATHTAAFVAELWTLLLSAAESPGGVPVAFVEQKKAELRAADERDRAAAAGPYRSSGGGAVPTVSSARSGPSVASGFMSLAQGGGGGGSTRAPMGMPTRDSGYGARAGSRFDQPGPPPPSESTRERDFGRPSTRDQTRSRSPPPTARRGRSPSPGRREERPAPYPLADDRFDRRRRPDDSYRRPADDVYIPNHGRGDRADDRYQQRSRDHRPSPPRRSRWQSRSPPPPPRRRSPSPAADDRARRPRSRSPAPPRHRRDGERSRTPLARPREQGRRPAADDNTPPPARKNRARSFTPTPTPEPELEPRA